MKACACYNLDEEERMISSSGGIYPLLAKMVLDEKGVVFAACYDDNLCVKHECIMDLEQLRRSQGSKYVASSLGNTFKDVINMLENGRIVAFVGTPCQCAGLESLIKEKRVDRSKLLLIDFVCHGIPSRRAWEAYKESMKNKGLELDTINMRDKTSGWSRMNYSWKWRTKNGTEIIEPERNVSYMKGMLADLYIRPSCSYCSFKGFNRCTDITLGDCWGVWSFLPEMDDNRGTSLILLHTDRGVEYFNRIQSFIRKVEIDINSAVNYNSCLVQSTPFNAKRKEFFERIRSGEDFEMVVNDLTKKSAIEKTKRKIKRFINKLI